MTRIPTLAQHQLTVSLLRTNMAKFNSFSSQVYTGLKAPRYSDVAASSGRLLRLDELQTKSENYIKTIDTTDTRLQLMETNLSAIDGLIVGFLNVLEQTRDNTAAPTAEKQAAEYLKNIASHLNETDGERYLFGGSQLRNTDPVKDLSTTASVPLPVAPALSPMVEFTWATGTAFQVGQTVTSSSGGTATVAAISQSVSGGGIGRVYLQQVGGDWNDGDTITSATATGTATTGLGYPDQDTRILTYTGLTNGPVVAATSGTTTSTNLVPTAGTVITTATGTAIVESVTATSGTAGRLVVRTLTGTFESGQRLSQGTGAGIPTATLSSVDHYTNPNAAFDAPVASKIADDLTVNYGVTANERGFDKIIRVMNYFQNQSIPFDEDQVVSAMQQLRDAREDVRAMRADVAFDRLTMKTEKASHTLAINLQRDARDLLIRADPAEAGASLNAMKTQLETSYAVLGTVKSLSLVNFLR